MQDFVDVALFTFEFLWIAQVNAVDALGETALHRAAAAGQISACRVLITHGADVSLRSFQGHTAAEVASEPVQKILHGNREESNLFFCNNLQLYF